MRSISRPAATPFVLAVAAALAFSLTGCSQGMILSDSVTPTPAAQDSSGSAITTPPPLPTPTVVDPVVAAQIASGLTPEQYQDVTSQVAALDATGTEMLAYAAELASIGDQFGKPLVEVDHFICPPTSDSPGTVAWGIAGALTGGAPPGCGTGYAASRDLTVAKVRLRAVMKQWTDTDYILVFVDDTTG
jgi:hypothetical protein